MKKAFITTILILTTLFFNLALADPPGPPDPGGNPVGSGGVPVGGPIGSGILILLALGVLYGAYRIYKIRVKKVKEEIS